MKQAKGKRICSWYEISPCIPPVKLWKSVTTSNEWNPTESDTYIAAITTLMKATPYLWIAMKNIIESYYFFLKKRTLTGYSSFPTSKKVVDVHRWELEWWKGAVLNVFLWHIRSDHQPHTAYRTLCKRRGSDTLMELWYWSETCNWLEIEFWILGA